MIRLRTWNLVEALLSILFTLALFSGSFGDLRIILPLPLALGVLFGVYGARKVERILEKNSEWLPSLRIRLLGPAATIFFIVGILLPSPAGKIFSSVFLPLALPSFGIALLSQFTVYSGWEKKNQKLILLDWQTWKSRIIAIPKGSPYPSGTVFT